MRIRYAASVADLLSIDEALECILARAHPLPAEAVPLEEVAGRFLAEPAAAAVDLPPFTSSAMDGFAVRAADVPATLRVVEQVAAGRPAARALEAGEAAAIATGGVVPEGADAVIPIEYVVVHDNVVEVGEPVAVGANVRPRGGDALAGAVVVEAGARLGPAQIGALAAAGVAAVTCARRPRAALLTTGTELRRPGEPLSPGQIYESNGLMLEAQLRSAGAEVERLPPVADDRDEHRRALERALEADLVVTSGGVSVGPHDLVRQVEAELGVEEVFWRVAVKPGKPISFGARGETLVFGLPGNPVSSLVGFELFVRPTVAALQGAAEPGPRFESGRLEVPLRRNPVRDELVRARRVAGAGGSALVPLSGQDSHMIVRAAAADALVLVPRGKGELEAGETVRYLRVEAG
jgi:molybdopterin molybdotransferase